MASLSKDQKQKIFLGILIFAGGVYGIWTGLMKPQFAAITSGTAKRASLTESVDAAKKEIAMASRIHAKAEELDALYKGVFKDIPAGAPITWVPPRVVKFFSSMGIDGVEINRGGSKSASGEGLTNFDELDWTVTIPNTSFVKFGTALAAWETKEPLIQVTSVSIVAGSPDAEFQSVDLSFHLLLPRPADAAPPPAR